MRMRARTDTRAAEIKDGDACSTPMPASPHHRTITPLIAFRSGRPLAFTITAHLSISAWMSSTYSFFNVFWSACARPSLLVQVDAPGPSKALAPATMSIP